MRRYKKLKGIGEAIVLFVESLLMTVRVTEIAVKQNRMVTLWLIEYVVGNRIFYKARIWQVWMSNFKNTQLGQ